MAAHVEAEQSLIAAADTDFMDEAATAEALRNVGTGEAVTAEARLEIEKINAEWAERRAAQQGADTRDVIHEMMAKSIAESKARSKAAAADTAKEDRVVALLAERNALLRKLAGVDREDAAAVEAARAAVRAAFEESEAFCEEHGIDPPF